MFNFFETILCLDLLCCQTRVSFVTCIGPDVCHSQGNGVRGLKILYFFAYKPLECTDRLMTNGVDLLNIVFYLPRIIPTDTTTTEQRQRRHLSQILASLQSALNAFFMSSICEVNVLGQYTEYTK